MATDILIIAHRGASAYRPEHTLESYDLAITMGADFIEPDLVMTKDGVLIARHENEISGTTDVAQKFPDRRQTKTIDGVVVTGWFTEDFTLTEINTLRAKERLADRDHSFDGQFPIPTLTEVIQLAKRRGEELGRTIGIYPEVKHPSYFSALGLPLEPALATELKRAHWAAATDPVIIQSFELTALHKLRHLVQSRLIFLLDEAPQRPYDNVLSGDPRTYGDYTKPAELTKLSNLLYGIGPYKRLIVPADPSTGRLLPATSLIIDSQKVGLKVHPYTFRSGKPFLAPEYNGDPLREFAEFFALGVDGIFTDNTDHAVKARETWRSVRKSHCAL